MDVDDITSEEGVPSSRRIIEDCDRALKSMSLVYANKGRMVPGLADRNGCRYSKDGTSCRGGKRPAKAVLKYERWLHPFGRVAQSLKLDKIVSNAQN